MNLIKYINPYSSAVATFRIGLCAILSATTIIGCSNTPSADNEITTPVQHQSSQQTSPITLADNLFVLDSKIVASAVINNTSLEFNTDLSSALDSLDVGDILISNVDNGFWRVIESITRNNEETIIIQTRDADFHDVIYDGKIHLQATGQSTRFANNLDFDTSNVGLICYPGDAECVMTRTNPLAACRIDQTSQMDQPEPGDELQFGGQDGSTHSGMGTSSLDFTTSLSNSVFRPNLRVRPNGEVITCSINDPLCCHTLNDPDCLLASIAKYIPRNSFEYEPLLEFSVEIENGSTVAESLLVAGNFELESHWQVDISGNENYVNAFPIRRTDYASFYIPELFVDIATDLSWEVRNTYSEGWQQLDHNESGWTTSIQPYQATYLTGATPIWHPDSGSDVAYFRKFFQLESLEDIAEEMAFVDIIVDDFFILYINGHHVGEGTLLELKQYNILQYLQQGENIIAVRVESIPSTPAHLSAKITLPKANVPSGGVQPLISGPDELNFNPSFYTTMTYDPSVNMAHQLVALIRDNTAFRAHYTGSGSSAGIVLDYHGLSYKYVVGSSGDVNLPGFAQWIMEHFGEYGVEAYMSYSGFHGERFIVRVPKDNSVHFDLLCRRFTFVPQLRGAFNIIAGGHGSVQTGFDSSGYLSAGYNCTQEGCEEYSIQELNEVEAAPTHDVLSGSPFLQFKYRLAAEVVAIHRSSGSAESKVTPMQLTYRSDAYILPPNCPIESALRMQSFSRRYPMETTYHSIDDMIFHAQGIADAEQCSQGLNENPRSCASDADCASDEVCTHPDYICAKDVELNISAMWTNDVDLDIAIVSPRGELLTLSETHLVEYGRLVRTSAGSQLGASCSGSDSISCSDLSPVNGQCPGPCMASPGLGGSTTCMHASNLEPFSCNILSYSEDHCTAFPQCNWNTITPIPPPYVERAAFHPARMLWDPASIECELVPMPAFQMEDTIDPPVHYQEVCTGTPLENQPYRVWIKNRSGCPDHLDEDECRESEPVPFTLLFELSDGTNLEYNGEVGGAAGSQSIHFTYDVPAPNQ